MPFNFTSERPFTNSLASALAQMFASHLPATRSLVTGEQRTSPVTQEPYWPFCAPVWKSPMT
jgi:hypothetical protein